MNVTGEFNTVNSPNWMTSMCGTAVFAPDGTAKRRRHSTVHVHETTCFACFPVWKKGSKGSAVTAVFLGFCTFFYTLDAVEADPSK